MIYIVSDGALNSTPTPNQSLLINTVMRYRQRSSVENIQRRHKAWVRHACKQLVSLLYSRRVLQNYNLVLVA